MRYSFTSVCLSLLVASSTLAQSIALTNLPAGDLTTPAFHMGIARSYPALSVNGFDCTAHGKTCDHGLGFKQILEQAAAPLENPYTSRLFQAIVKKAQWPFISPTNRSDVKQNTQIAELRSFVTVAALLLDTNGYDPGALGLPAHQAAVASLLEVLENLDFMTFDESFSDDAVKWTGPLGSLARTVDFYLALEQAYTHYGRTDDALFSCETKSAVLDALQRAMTIVDDLGNRSAMDLNFINIFGLDVASIIRDVSYDEIQAGNWPMKVHVAVGYAAIVQQLPQADGCASFEPVEDYERWLGRALRSTGGPDRENRSHHWAYQTDGGQRFWAEGPFYFNYGLTTAVPFLHAARAQSLLDENDDFTVSDPFRSDWFLEPLRGFADIVTPDGSTPPLEDGNKIPVEAAHLLNWGPDYGEPVVGQKFSWISTAQTTLPSTDLWVHALAIPRNMETAPPPPTVAPGQSAQHAQQIVLRRDGQTGSCADLPASRQTPCHYILLNGETTESIRPGEGHEQSDQLQLLYYVDDTSYLIDGGYDSAPGVLNSTWSDYRNHNVMTADRIGMEGGHGGLPGPVAGFSCTRKVSSSFGDFIMPAACMYADHYPVELWRHSQSGRVDLIEAAVSIYPDSPEDGDELLYERTLFFIDDEIAPYLIDINAARARDPAMAGQIKLNMQYHGNAPASHQQAAGTSTLWNALWAAPDSLGQAPKTGTQELFIQTFAVESDYPITLQPLVMREASIDGLKAGEGIDVSRLSLSNTIAVDARADTVSAPSHTTVAFIQPRLDGGTAYGLPLIQTANATEMRPRSWQLYTWQIDEETIDALIVRSISSPAENPLIVPLDLPSGASWTAAPDFVSTGILFEAAHNMVSLNAGVKTGFLRLHSSARVGAGKEKGVGLYLEQNSPNPFGAFTRISFEIPTTQHVRLDIFDVLGRHTTSLVDGIMNAGRHTIIWEPGSLSDGIYLYRLQTEEKTSINQMTRIQR